MASTPNSRAARRAARAAAVLTAVVLMAVGCAGRSLPERIPDPGIDLSGIVDSEPAARLLADLLARRSPDPHLSALASGLLQTSVVSARAGLQTHGLPDQARLRELGRQVSVDFAALVFARIISADDKSRAVQAAFERFLRDGPVRSQELLRLPGAFPYTVLFAPAWLYRTHPWTGADFAHQRRLLDRMGLAHRLIETAETGSVEDNAAVIAAAVREATRDSEQVILVSTSKSGAEVALALSRLLSPEESAGVVAWLNVGGALGGTPLADAALRPPASWFTRLAFALTGWSWTSLRSMATGPSRERLEGARLPDTIAVVNLVAVPVSGTVGSMAYGAYQFLRRHGPNDGVILLADAVWPGGANLVALGSDHFFTALQQEAHGLALLRAVDFAVRLDDAPGPPIDVGGVPRQFPRGAAGRRPGSGAIYSGGDTRVDHLGRVPEEVSKNRAAINGSARPGTP